MDLKFLLKALDSSAVGAFITDRNGNIEWVSAGFTRITGYPSEEAIGRNTRSLKSSAHSQYFYSELWNTVLAGQSWRGTITNKHKNGKPYSCIETVAPVLGNAGEITHFMAIMQEVGAGRMLQETTDRYYSLLESLGDGVISSTAEGLIRMANPAAARVLGLPRDMLLGRELITFIHPEDRALVQSAMEPRR